MARKHQGILSGWCANTPAPTKVDEQLDRFHQRCSHKLQTADEHRREILCDCSCHDLSIY